MWAVDAKTLSRDGGQNRWPGCTMVVQRRSHLSSLWVKDTTMATMLTTYATMNRYLQHH